jgi:hypothetical protein
MLEETVMRRQVAALTMAAIMMGAALLYTNAVFSNPEGARLDLYTQKQPYSGMGVNVTSDAFGLGEEVQVFALATYNDYPVQGILVAFGIFGASNPVSNVTFTRSALTDRDGVANITFRISYDTQTMFGNWTVIGNAQMADITVQDFLFFRVGWIVKITSIETVNTDCIPQQNFTQASVLGVKLQVSNIAFVERTTTVSLAVNDSMGIRINATEINNVVVPPNETVLLLDEFLYIPESAYIGRAAISASVLTKPVEQGGVPYSPEVLAFFNIIIRDIGILSVTPDILNVYAGQSVNIDVVVRNKGMQTETFNTSAYYNHTLIGVMPVNDLSSSSQTTIRFTWNTSDVIAGTYLISADAGPVPGEIALSDNVFNDGYVEVNPIIYDIAIINVTASSYSIAHGDIVYIDVVAENLGTLPESFNVTAFYDSSPISVISISSLPSGQQQLLTFHWDTHGLQLGSYTLSARASEIPGETNVANNYFEDGVVEINAPATHDIAVTDVHPSSTLVFIGETVHVMVVVTNLGSATESFNVTAYYDSVAIASQQVVDFGPGSNRSLEFEWNTAGLASGNYHMSASATVLSGETNTSNNLYDDGVVQLILGPGMLWFGLEWWQLFLLLLLILVIIILILFLYRRRRKEEERSETSFKTGFVAWYYGRSLR